ncbi:MAG TPA: hypothetical protein VJ792_08885 [Candidatus Nitrosotalea sp.]|nr:hypothetical protein [Candidatus Nitrosotalea sp.]
MIRQDKNSLNLKVVGLIVLYAALAVFSVAWYETLTGMDCGTKALQPGSVRTSPGDDAHSCNLQLQFHWIKFYGINGLIYGASAIVILAGARRKNKN